MESTPLLDRVGRRRSPATTSSFHQGLPPRNKGVRYPPDPPTVEEIVAVMRAAGDSPEGVRLRGIIVALWRAGLRISEALALNETDLDPDRGSVLVRHGKGEKRREVGMDRWAWAHLEPWLELRTAAAGGPAVLRRARSDPRAAVHVSRDPRSTAPGRGGGRCPAPVRAAPLGRPDRYADGVGKLLLRRVRAQRRSAYSEVLEELQERVGGSIAAGFGVEWFGPVDRLLFVGHVGV